MLVWWLYQEGRRKILRKCLSWWWCQVRDGRIRGGIVVLMVVSRRRWRIVGRWLSNFFILILPCTGEVDIISTLHSNAWQVTLTYVTTILSSFPFIVLLTWTIPCNRVFHYDVDGIVGCECGELSCTKVHYVNWIETATSESGDNCFLTIHIMPLGPKLEATATGKPDKMRVNLFQHLKTNL